MAVIAVDEIKGSRTASQTSDWKRHYTRVFRVQTDNPATTAQEVGAAPGIPTLGQTYVVPGSPIHDLGAFVQQVDVSEESEDGKSWLVTVTYGPYNAGEFPKDPTQWPLRVSWGATQWQRGMEKDQDGKPVLNSAKDPFEETATRDDSRTRFTVVRNEPRYDPRIAAQYRDHLNEGTFCGFSEKTVKCCTIEGELKYDTDAGTEDGYYVEVQYVFEVNEDGWDLVVIDQGYAKLDPVTGLKTEFVDTVGTRVSKPQALNGSGQPNTEGADTVFIRYRRYDTADFAALGLNFAGAPGQDVDEGSGSGVGDGDGDGSSF